MGARSVVSENVNCHENGASGEKRRTNLAWARACARTMGAAWSSVYGSMASADPLDVVHARLIVIWGANPTVSNTHFPPLVAKAVERGAKVVVIDPRRTAMAKRADLHLAIRPGTDIVLASAIANHWRANGHLDETFIADHSTCSTDAASTVPAIP